MPVREVILRGRMLVRRRGRLDFGSMPGQGLPGEEEDMTPEWGHPEGEVDHPDSPPERPLPNPPGVWPPLEGPSHPIYPIGPEDGVWQPGEVWPPMRPPPGSIAPPGAAPGQPAPKSLFFAACRIPDVGWKWIVVDLNAVHRPERPDNPAGGPGGRPPARPEPEGRH